MIVGTAGHIDHGKTALVRALTGVDTDRLPEEKRRGITIDLGFAPLVLPGIGQVGVVDVPGHEAFVRTMIAGATGIDIALLVVAADAGLMPQTHEHLAILGILGVKRGVVALTKCDLVDEDWLALLDAEIRETLGHSTLKEAPIVRTSARTGVGIDLLRTALADVARGVPPHRQDDLFRLPVDRAFVVKGTGTVVTGTVWSGSLARDGEVRLFPGDHLVRVRGLHAHGAEVERVRAGDRAAIALAGVSLDAVGRGATLVAGQGWRESRVLRALVFPSSDAMEEMGPRTRVRLHLGTRDAAARLVTAGVPLEEGTAVQARIVLDAPVVARMGDRFVVRSTSPAETLAGGLVLDPCAPARAKVFPLRLAEREKVFQAMLAEARLGGMDMSELPVRLGLPPSAVRGFLAGERTWVVGERIFSEGVRGDLEEGIVTNLRLYHKSHPLDPGASAQWLRSRFVVSPAVVDAALARLVAAGKVMMHVGLVALSGFAPMLSEKEEHLRADVLGAILSAGTQPPSFTELAGLFGVSRERVVDVMHVLLREGELVAVEPERYYASAAVRELQGRLAAGMTDEREYSPAELKEVLGFTRKFTIPFLEYCDRETYTIRGTAGRRLAARSR